MKTRTRVKMLIFLIYYHRYINETKISQYGK